MSYRKYVSVPGLLAAVLAVGFAAAPALADPAVTPVQLLGDWLDQDNPKGEYFRNEADSEKERELIGRVLEEAGEDAFEIPYEMAWLVEANVPGSDDRWRGLYARACMFRRAKRLAPLIARGHDIVFTKHYDLGGSHYAYTEGLSDAQRERHFVPGSSLCLLTPDKAFGDVRDLIDDPNGVIRDPDVSYDGERILFAWKKSDRQDDYHLYEMTPATGEIHQLTDGLGHADYEGQYLPGGDIVFSSTRCVQIVDCWWTEVSNLYLCDGDGKHMRRVGFDQVHTNYPTVLPDGRVIYTRWDYNDRGQIYPQGLFVMNADGTGQGELYGNNSWFPTTIMHARAIPGTRKILAIFSGHHSHQRGKLGVIDPSAGTQEADGATLVAPIRETRPAKIDAYGQGGEQFQYPYPLTETTFLVSYSWRPIRGRSRAGSFGVYYMDMDGRRELLVADEQVSCQQPVPLAARPEPPTRPSTVDYARTDGAYYVRDVYAGKPMRGVPRGTAKRLRVVTMEFRAAGIGSNRSRGPAGGALSSTPPSCNNGAWDVKRVLGSAELEPDGSAYFTVPARTPVYFQLVDANGCVIQTMRSWSTLQPGETLACVGCHEDKAEASAAKGHVSMALRQGPAELEPFHGPARGFSFQTEIQPILDRHCIRCHDNTSKKLDLFPKPTKKDGKKDEGNKGDKKDKAPMSPFPEAKAKPAKQPATRPAATQPAQPPFDPGNPFSLLGEPNLDPGAKRYWSDSYLALTQDGRPNRLVQWLNVQSIPPTLPPYFAGSSQSGLVSMLRTGHHGVRLSREEMDKLCCWIDLLVPYCGDYREANAWTEAEKAMYEKFLDKRRRMEAVERANLEALMKR